MKKLVSLVISLFVGMMFAGCVAEKDGQLGLKGFKTGHVYTKEDLSRYKKIFDDGKHIVLQVKEEIKTVKSNSEKTE